MYHICSTGLAQPFIISEINQRRLLYFPSDIKRNLSQRTLHTIQRQSSADLGYNSAQSITRVSDLISFLNNRKLIIKRIYVFIHQTEPIICKLKLNTPKNVAWIFFFFFSNCLALYVKYYQILFSRGGWHEDCRLLYFPSPCVLFGENRH